MLNEQLEIEKRHQEICDGIHQLYLKKNAAYGDSFHQLYEKLGIISAVTQITHKYNRLINMAKQLNAGQIKADDEVFEESIKDTLLDIANYSILTYQEIEREENNQK